MEDAPVITSKISLQLDLPPSCVQFCQSHPDLFVVGTYNLEKQESPKNAESREEADNEEGKGRQAQSRTGSLLVFRTDGDKVYVYPGSFPGIGLDHAVTDLFRDLIQTLEQPSAVLDLRFHPDPQKSDTLAVVSSTATLAVFRLDPSSNPSAPLIHLSTSQCDDLEEGNLFLQCIWHPTRSNVIAVTVSNGAARLLWLDEEWKIRGFRDLSVQNQLEAWSIALAPGTKASESDSGVFFTAYCGGDDSMLRYTSCTISDDEASTETTEAEEPFSCITVKSKHDAGVTAILPLSISVEHGARVVLTGSYDEYLRVFAIRDLHDSMGMRSVEVLAEISLGGGVWRLDLIDVESEGTKHRVRVLASCMHAGARIVEISQEDRGGWACKVLARMEEHQSMNYGSHFMPFGSGAGGGKTHCVSTSFYDRLLCLWDYSPVL